MIELFREDISLNISGVLLAGAGEVCVFPRCPGKLAVACLADTETSAGARHHEFGEYCANVA